MVNYYVINYSFFFWHTNAAVNLLWKWGVRITSYLTSMLSNYKVGENHRCLNVCLLLATN